MPGLRRARTSSGVLRELEHALGDDVPLHFRRSGEDRLRARPQELPRPIAIVARLGAGPHKLPARTEKVERRLAEALIELTPVDLLDRQLRVLPCRYVDSAHRDHPPGLINQVDKRSHKKET